MGSGRRPSALLLPLAAATRWGVAAGWREAACDRSGGHG